VKARRRTGFTLLELLIAITLLGFILSLLFGGMRLGARSWEAGDKRATQAAHTSQVQNFLRRELTQVYPYRWKKKPNPELAFAGEDKRVRFAAPIAARLGYGGIYLISLELADGAEGKRLIMKRVIPDAETADFSALDGGDAETDVLQEKVDSVAIDYFGAETALEEPKWSDRWDNGKLLPYLVRLRIKLADGSAWPDLVVPPVVGPNTGCMWDGRNNRCVNG
jgi:general secretion pathway protein J